MYSILNSVSNDLRKSKINKNLISIVSEYLLPIKNEYKKIYSKAISVENYISNEFTKQCYLLQMKRRFPQPHYNLSSKYRITFHIPNLYRIRNSDPIFLKNKYIGYYISTFIDTDIILFHTDFW